MIPKVISMPMPPINEILEDHPPRRPSTRNSSTGNNERKTKEDESDTNSIERTHRWPRRLICGVTWADYKWNRADRELQKEPQREIRVGWGVFHTWRRCVRSAALYAGLGCVCASAAAFIRANKCEKEGEKKERKKGRKGVTERRRAQLERGRCSGSSGREYVRQITYYDALLYTNTYTYRGLCRYMGVNTPR